MPRAASLLAKVNKKIGVAVERSKRSRQEDLSDESRYGDVKSFEIDNSGKRRLESRAKKGQKVLVNSDHNKKRTYAGENVGRKENFSGVDRMGYSRTSSERKNSKVKYDSKNETISSGKPRTIWVTEHKEAAKSAQLPKGKSTSKAKKSNGKDDVRSGLLKTSGSKKVELNTRSDKHSNIGTTVYSQKNVKKSVRDDKSNGKDDVRNGLLKTHGSKNIDLNTRLDKRSNIGTAVYSQKTVKKGFRDDKSLEGNSKEQEVKVKKRKRIQLDPYDISNKRLDDNIVGSGVTREKDPEEKAEMSKNAQFRAIQPSASILSFVEDNLLGRRRLIELKRAGYNTDLSVPLDNIPSSKSSERENIEENIFRSKLEFFAAAKVSSSFPPPEVPEIAFAGRSNVGKSSLLNALTRQWGVVRTSDKPGHTQSINFFKLGPKISLVDLPGYGFAYAKEEVKDAWEELVKEYVSTRVNLKRVCLLVDTKWGMKPRDQELIDLMERYQTKYQIVLTKTDTVFPIDVARRAMQIEENLRGHKSAVQPVMMVSSKSGAGVRCLRTVLAKIARFAKV